MDQKTIKWLFFLFLMVFFGVLFLFMKDKRRYLVFLLIFFASFRVGLIFYHYNGVMLMDFVLIALFILDFFSGRKTKLHYKKISLPIFCLLIWSLISTVFAVEKGWAFSEWTRVFRGFLIFSYILSFVKTKGDLKIILYGLMTGFFVQCFIGFLQWRYGYLGLWVLGENMLTRWRSSGTFSHPVVFSTYLAFMLPLMFRLFIFSRGATRQKIILYGFILALGFL